MTTSLRRPAPHATLATSALAVSAIALFREIENRRFSLRFYLILALAIILIRLVFRVIFNFSDGADDVVLRLPVRGAVPADAFRGKYVLVGAAASGLGEMFATPVSQQSRLMPGVEVVAHVLDARLSGDQIAPASRTLNTRFNLAPVAAALLALLLWLLARKRKAQQEAEKHLRMARALEEEQGAGFDSDTESFDGVEAREPGVTLSPAVVAASAAAAVAAEKVAEPVAEAEPEPEPQADPHAALLAQVDQCLAEGRLNRAAELLEPAVAAAPERDDLRLKLMDVYARQGDQSAFAEQERQLPASEQNVAEVASLKERYPAMLGLAAAGLGAAALAAEMDEQYVQELLHDEPEAPVVADVVPDELSGFEPHVEAEPEAVAQAEPDAELDAFDEVPTLDATDLAEQDLDSAFDLSLDDLEGLEGLEDLEGLEGLADLQIDDPQAPQAMPPADIATLDDLDFDTLLQEQTQAQAETPAPQVPDVQEQAVTEVPAETPAEVPAEPMPEPALVEPEPILDDLSDFDLDMGADLAPPAPEAAPAATPEAPLDIEAQLAAFDDSLGLDDSFPDLADDFDLSLADEPDPLDASFAAELDDVNAELDKLSQNLEQPSIAPHFTAEDASDLMLDEPEFDYLSGTDEAATKLDLARAYIDMGDNDGAREILDEVMKEGTETQRKEAIELRSQMS